MSQATYSFNQQEKRVEIRFPFPPERHTKNELYRCAFVYQPELKAWVSTYLCQAEASARRIIHYFNKQSQINPK